MGVEEADYGPWRYDGRVCIVRLDGIELYWIYTPGCVIRVSNFEITKECMYSVLFLTSH